MASSPAFASVPRLGLAALTAANTARDGSGTLSTLLTAVTAGTRIERIAVHCAGDAADSIVTLFIHDGTNARLWNEMDIGDPAAASNTLMGLHYEITCRDVVLPSGFSLRCALTVVPTSGSVNVFAFGADLT